MIKEIQILLSRYNIGYATEAIMQEHVHELLSSIVACSREVSLSTRDRIDVLTECGIGIECKIKGSPSAIVSQLLRYAEHDRIKALILVTSKRTHLATACFQEKQILGKPLIGVWVCNS